MINITINRGLEDDGKQKSFFQEFDALLGKYGAMARVSGQNQGCEICDAEPQKIETHSRIGRAFAWAKGVIP